MKISIEQYCENCPEFSPTVVENGLYSNGELYARYDEREIECKHKSRCKNLMRYLDRQYRKLNGGDTDGDH